MNRKLNIKDKIIHASDFKCVECEKCMHSENNLSLKDVGRFLEEINPKHIEALIAINQLFNIAEAWNKADGFVPDFSDCEQFKWIPCFKYDKDAARFVYYVSSYTTEYASAFFGPHFCFMTPERAEQFGRQFADLYNKVFLTNK